MSTGSAQTLRCPSCGAPAPLDATRCEYCRSRLATVSCASCFGLLVEGAAFCQHCGAPRARTDGISEQRTRCPACRGEMRWITVGPTDLLECDTCDGTWVEAVVFEHLCADREHQAAVLHAPIAPHKVTGVQAERIQYRPCLRCGKLMNRINFGRMSGAIVDVCRGHGTFLDRGELHQVVRFIQEGGLDRAREVQRQDLEEARRQAEQIARAPSRAEPVAGPYAWNERWLSDLLTALFGTKNA